jgi:hypothetical protein
MNRKQSKGRNASNHTNTEIKEFDADSIQNLPQISEYFKVLILNGVSAYIDNANVKAKALKIDDTIVPLIIGNPKQKNADVCSPYSHYVRYTLEEIIKRNKRIPKWLFEAAIKSFGSILRACGIERVIYINNWLYATNPFQSLSSHQIQRLTNFLNNRYPYHAIVHRTINPYLYQDYHDSLVENGYKMVKSRLVYLIDPQSREFLIRTNPKLDLKLLENSPYDIIQSEKISDNEFSRITDLYRSLYLDKHSYLNPQLNPSFFSLIIRNNILNFKGLKKDGIIDAFANFFVEDKIVTGAFIGYDRSKPQKAGLYRQVIALLISEAIKRGLLLNISAAVGNFKILRGAFPVVEYDAVYYNHLPNRRHIAWWLIKKEGNTW